MSWQGYIDQSLMGTGKIAKAAIHGHDGNVWAKSAGFDVSAAEVKKVVEGFKDPSVLAASGIHLNSVKYQFLRCLEDKEIYGKKGSDDGCCIIKTPKTLIIGVYCSGMQAGDANKVCGALGDYLAENGF